MGIFEQFPYTNFHDLNLDWILHAIQSMDKKLNEFVASNVLSYAEPIQWDIETQYAKNTVVIDPKTGTAYMSINPVPVGQLLTNKYYWQPIFNYDEIVNTLKKQIAAVQADQHDTIPVAVGRGSLVWVANKLYRLTKSLDAGSKIIENTNAVPVTVEEIINDVDARLTENINDVDARLTENINDIDARLTENINDVDARLTENINDIDARLTDASNLIAQEISDRNSAVTALDERITQETTSRENADNAIRETLKKLDVYTTPEMFGAIGDGVTNDYDAITNAINSGLPVVFAAKSYKINTGITITRDSVVIIGTCDWGDKKTTIISGDMNASVISIKGTSSRRIERCNISNINFTYENTADQSAVSIEYANHTYINKCSALNAKKGFRVYGTVRTLLDNCITLAPNGYTGEALGYVLGDDNDSFDEFAGANASLYLKQCLAVGSDNVNYFGYLISRATSDVFMTDCEVSICNVGLYIKSDDTLNNTSKNDINIDHFVCDTYKQFGIFVQNQSFGSIRIVNSYFAPRIEVSDMTAGILFENSRGCFSVEGNQFIGSWIPVNNTETHRGIALNGATGVYCANNMIKDMPLPVALYGDSSFCTFEDNILEDIVRESQTDTYLLEGVDINHIKINSTITGARGAFKGSPVNMVSTNITYVEINNVNINRFVFTQTTNNIMKYGNVKYDDIGLVESHPLILVTGIMPV